MKLGAWEAYTAGYTGSIRSVKQLGEMAELSTIERGSTRLDKGEEEQRLLFIMERFPPGQTRLMP
jgi:hypothetical protein